MDEGQWLTNRAVEHRLRVRYSETDQAGIVYHANFFVWFHEARDAAFRAWSGEVTDTSALRSADFRDIAARGRAVSSDSLEEIGYRFLVIDAACRYILPARYGDELIVTAIPRKTTFAKLMFAYKVRNAKTQRLLAEGTTTSAIIGRSGRMLIRMPPHFGWVFESYRDSRLDAKVSA